MRVSDLNTIAASDALFTIVDDLALSESGKVALADLATYILDKITTSGGLLDVTSSAGAVNIDAYSTNQASERKFYTTTDSPSGTERLAIGAKVAATQLRGYSVNAGLDSEPASTLEVNGTLGVLLTNVSGTATVYADTNSLINPSDIANRIITLPNPASCPNRVVVINSNSGGGVNTVQSAVGTVNNSATVQIGSGGNKWGIFVSDGASNWVSMLVV